MTQRWGWSRIVSPVVAILSGGFVANLSCGLFASRPSGIRAAGALLDLAFMGILSGFLLRKRPKRS